MKERPFKGERLHQLLKIVMLGVEYIIKVRPIRSSVVPGFNLRSNPDFLTGQVILLPCTLYPFYRWRSNRESLPCKDVVGIHASKGGDLLKP